MIYNYWSKKWELDRFIVYVQKRKDIMTYIENNLSLLAKKEKKTTTMAGFKYAFEKFDPPNGMITWNEMWELLTKK